MGTSARRLPSIRKSFLRFFSSPTGKQLHTAIRRFLPFIMLAVFIGLTVYLGTWVLKAGYYYQFDNDEFYHMQVVYVLSQGMKAYTGFYLGPYTPLFHWFLLPFISGVGFSFDTLYTARFIMAALYVLRLLVTFLLVKKLFGRLPALISIPLILLDPFTVYAGMQIRPDNLMLLVLQTGILTLVYGILDRKPALIFMAGVLFSVSVLVLFKAAPAVIVVGATFFFWTILTKHFRSFLQLLFGGIVVAIAFLGYFYYQGAMTQLIQQDIRDVFSVFVNFSYPLPVTFFYQPANNVMYGEFAKPLTWFFAFILPLLGFGGLSLTVAPALKKLTDPKQMFRFALVLGGVVSWLSVMMAPSAFVQYFLPLLWFCAVFGAVALSEFVQAFGNGNFWRQTAGLMVLLIALGFFTRSGVAADTYHAGMTGDSQRLVYEKIWKKFPADVPVFGYLLFRPIVYPVPGPINNSGGMLIRMPVEKFLEEKRTPKLLLDDYTMDLLPYDTQIYIRTHYQKMKGEDSIWSKTTQQ